MLRGGAINEIKICQICDNDNKVIITCDKHHYCEKCFTNIFSYLTSNHNSCAFCIKNATKWRK